MNTETQDIKPPFPPQHQNKPGIEAKLNPRPRYKAPNYKGADKLKEKVVLITGGDSGIGRSVATLCAREKADIAIVYLPEEEEDAQETKRVVEEEGRRALLISGNVEDEQFCNDAISQVIQEYGRLDVLVNNAAFQQHQKSIDDLTTEQLEKTFHVNLFGYFFMAKAALRYLPRGGSIINTGSITGLEGSKNLLDYAATKGAIHAFTKSLAKNLIDKEIRVNCVAPGPVWTPLNPSDREPNDVAHFGEDTPMKRPAQPEEIAPAYIFFASNADSGFITGEVLTILGGDTVAA